MKKVVTRDELIVMINRLDKRTNGFTSEQYDDIINSAYGELSLLAQPFSDEVVVELDQYYDLDELSFTVDIDADVIYIYDLYLTDESNEPLTKIYNSDIVYQDGREVGRVHVKLDLYGSTAVLDNLVVKYSYTPVATSENVYFDQPTLNVMRDALSVAVYISVNDTNREADSRIRLSGNAEKLLPQYPQDYMMR